MPPSGCNGWHGCIRFAFDSTAARLADPAANMGRTAQVRQNRGMSVRTPDPDWNPDDEPVVRPPANPGWLTDLELAEVRGRLPLLYVEAVPVRVDGLGQVIEVGVLLRANAVGEMTRTLVSGRVMYGETLRDALFRHLEKDLGPMAFPLLPASPVPFAVAEYFPMPGISARSPTSGSTPCRSPTSCR